MDWKLLALWLSSGCLAGCDQLPFVITQEEGAARACEEALKPSLVSPSSYKRVWYDYTDRKEITKEEFPQKVEAEQDSTERSDAQRLYDAYNAKTLNECKAAKKDCSRLEPTYENSGLAAAKNTGYVLIEYESDNAFSATLPGYYQCRLTAPTEGEYSSANVFTSGPVPRDVGDQTKKLYESVEQS